MKIAEKVSKVFIWVVCTFPLVFLGMLALASAWRFPDIFPQNLSLQNINLIFNAGSTIAQSIFNSLYISGTVSLVAVVSAFFISKHIAYHIKKQMFLFFAYLPFVLSPIIYAACLNYFFVVAGLSGTIMGVMLAQFIIVFPYCIILFLSHWNLHMQAYDNLAITLGGSFMQRYMKVIIPLSKHILLIAFFQSFLISWFEFGLTNYIGVGQVQTLTIKVYQYIGEANVYLAAFSSLLLIIPPIILLWLNKRFVFHQQ